MVGKENDVFGIERRIILGKNGFLSFMSGALLLLVGGCGPVYETTYELHPPENYQGRVCTNQCSQTQQFCQQNCASQIQMCEYNERLRSQNEYYVYVEQQRAANQAIVRTPESFYDSFRCRETMNVCQAQCQSSYRSCFAGCGGSVIPHTQCVASCEEH